LTRFLDANRFPLRLKTLWRRTDRPPTRDDRFIHTNSQSFARRNALPALRHADNVLLGGGLVLRRFPVLSRNRKMIVIVAA